VKLLRKFWSREDKSSQGDAFPQSFLVQRLTEVLTKEPEAGAGLPAEMRLPQAPETLPAHAQPKFRPAPELKPPGQPGKEFPADASASRSAAEEAGAGRADLEREAGLGSPPERGARELERFANELLVRSTGALRRQAEAERAALDEQLRAARESFLVEFRQRLSSTAESVLSKQWEALLQNARAAAAEITAEELQRQGTAEVLSDRAAKALEKNVQQLLNDAAKKLEEQTQALAEQLRSSREAFLEEAEKRLTSLPQPPRGELDPAAAEQHRQELRQWLDQQAQSAQAASESVTRATEEALAQLRKCQEQLEASLRGSLEEEHKRAAEVFSEELHRQDLPAKLASQAAQELEKQAEHLLANFSKQLGDEAERLSERLRDAGRSGPEGAQEQSANRARAADGATEQFVNESLRQSMQQLRAEHDEWVKRYFEPLRRHTMYVIADNRPENREDAQGGLAARVPGRLGRLARAGLGVAAVALAAALAAGAYFSGSSPAPKPQLRADPPAAFMDNHPGWSAKRRASEDEVARAYWQAAIQNVQDKYNFGTPLPEQPPREFKIDAPSPPNSPDERAHYWEKLREVWGTPEAWEQTSDSSSGGIAALLNRLRTSIVNFISAHRP